MKHITGREILSQLNADLIGKDAYRGVSLSYALLANQFGHFSLGFIPTVLIYLSLEKYGIRINEKFWPFVTVAVFWILFEGYNFYTIIKPPAVPVFKFGVKKFPFRLSWGNLLYDLLTDLGFFCLGSFLAGSFFVFTLYQGVIYIIPFILLVIPFIYWYRTKMYLQAAHYPFQFRLSQWDTYISDENKIGVLKFMESDFSGMHLVISGKYDAERLGVAIATEMSYQHRKCTYLTAMKLLGLFSEEGPGKSSISSKNLWTWEDATFLVIDDMNVSYSTDEEIITCKEFSGCINNKEFSSRNKKLLREKKVIWIFGRNIVDKTNQMNWIELLEEIGVDKSNILTVNLSENPATVI